MPANHPLRAIRTLANEALSALEDAFDAMYAEGGRPSVPPERLLKASLLIALYSMAHALMENRHGLLMDLRVTEASGTAERQTALDMLREHVETRATVSADKGYDTRGFVAESRAIGVTPHVAKNEHARRRSSIDGRTTRHQGYSISQTLRMTIERIFGWTKSAAGFRRTRFRGRRKTQFAAHLTGAAYNLLRVSRLRACTS